MSSPSQFKKRTFFFAGNLFFSCFVTILLLLLLSLVLYRFSISEHTLSICLTGICILVSFLSGFLTGKKEKSRKFLFGLLSGFLYFAVIVLISLLIHQGLPLTGRIFTTLLLCCLCGMFGGMLS